MQLKTILVLGLSCAALAHPTLIYDEVSLSSNQIEDLPSSFNQSHYNELEKRGTFGWVASYGYTDSKCSGHYAMPRPKIKTNCVKFTSVSNNLGVSLTLPQILYLLMSSFLFFREPSG